jgi:hypothetical protein
MKRQRIRSKTLQSVGYSLFRGTLQVEFKEPNRTFDFHNVPVRLYIGLMNAPSKARFFNKYIKDNFPSEEMKEM